jgi:hypothetical protein
MFKLYTGIYLSPDGSSLLYIASYISKASAKGI